MAEEQTLIGLLGDVAQYFIDCRANAAKGSAAERRFTIFIDAVHDAREKLNAQEPVEPAIGGNQKSCWYYICPICQLAIDKGNKYCRHCGRAVKWND